MQPYLIDGIWLAIAFVGGLAAKRAGLPALIGFLCTGLVLHVTGLEEGHLLRLLNPLSDLGIILLLFTVGLKIKTSSLFQKEVWLPASAHVVLFVLFTAAYLWILNTFQLPLFKDLSGWRLLLPAFALSFSSTVFAVKALEQRGELTSLHGKTAIGILILQDVFAVIFLAIASEQPLNSWSLALLLYLGLVRYLLHYLLDQAGHGELLTLFGFFAALVTGALVFYLTGIKPDLGALAIGVILSGHSKSGELYDRMMTYKDFFLIAFFIRVGMYGLPDGSIWLAALLLVPAVAIKGILFMRLLGGIGLPIRSAFLSTFALTNFSEFGLIVAVVGVQQQWLSPDWVMVIALLMTVSFVMSSPLNVRAHLLFDRYSRIIIRVYRHKAELDVEPDTLGAAEYLIIGMGTLGSPAFTFFDKRSPGKVIGVDYKQEQVESLSLQGYNVVLGDAASSLFWTYKRMAAVKLVLLAMSEFNSNKNAFKEISKLKRRKFKVAVITHYPEEIGYFKEQGVDFVYDYKSHIGSDFAEQSVFLLDAEGK